METTRRIVWVVMTTQGLIVRLLKRAIPRLLLVVLVPSMVARRMTVQLGMVMAAATMETEVAN
jgi:hypothetical protein